MKSIGRGNGSGLLSEHIGAMTPRSSRRLGSRQAPRCGCCGRWALPRAFYTMFTARYHILSPISDIGDANM